MEAWLRQIALNAQLRTGLGAGVVIWGVAAVSALALALVFLLIAAFVWLAHRYGNIVAPLLLGGFFVLLTLIAGIACVMIRRSNIERARLELELRKRAAAEANLIDPGLLAIGNQLANSVGWHRAASLAVFAVLGAALAKEWLGHAKKADQDDKPGAS
jgi:Ca2+/Na+ antiporter